MVYKLFAPQIPMYWEMIKYAAVNAEGIEEENQQRYLNDLYFNLLNGTYQCLVFYNDKEEIVRMCIFYMEYNEIIKKKFFHLKIGYGFQSGSIEEWAESLNELKKLAESLGCQILTGTTANEKLISLAKKIGWKVSTQTFEIVL